MIDAYLKMAGLFLVAWLFGGMLFFSAGFAAFLFRYLPAVDARLLIRKAFPLFYLFVICVSGLAMVIFLNSDLFSAALLGFTMLTTVIARQILMPAINDATDSGLQKRFIWLHSFSVLLTLVHIWLAAVVLTRLQISFF